MAPIHIPSEARPERQHPAEIAVGARSGAQPSVIPVSVLATVLALGACASTPDGHSAVSARDCPIETRRQLVHSGPQGKAFPVIVSRTVRQCPAAAVSPEMSLRNR